MKPKGYGPQQYGPQQITLASSVGDIFWDLPPFITYIAGTSIGATIYVANPSAEDRQYALLSKLAAPTGENLLEESIVVYGFAWFTVEAGQFVKLHAELAFELSNVVLSVVLVEKETDLEVDSVSTYLVAPTAAQLPPGFPGAVTAGFDWNSLLAMMMFIPIMGVMAGAFKEEEEEEKPKAIEAPPPKRLELPPGRG